MNNEEELDFELDETVEEEETPQDKPEAIDWKATALRYKKKLANVKTNKPAQKEDTSETKSELARLEMRIDGYSDEAIAFAMKNGGKESLNDPYVKAAIEAIQEQKRAEQATVASETSKSDIERKFTQEEIAAMSPEEMYKILPKASQ